MKINNEKGHIHPIWFHHLHHLHHLRHFLGVASKVRYPLMGGYIAAGILITMIVAFGPAWDQAKDNHTEAIYQGQEDGIQKFFDKLPGAHRAVQVITVSGNGGNFAGGNDTVNIGG